MRLLQIAGFWIIGTFSGCHRQATPEPPRGVDGSTAQVGSYSPAEIEIIRTTLDAYTLPADPDSVARILTKPLRPVPIRFVDWAKDRDNKGRVGGMIEDYFLSSDFVLRVASAYYQKGDEHFTKIEWIVLLRVSERDTYTRSVYPTDRSGSTSSK